MKRLALIFCLLIGQVAWSGCYYLSSRVLLDRHSDVTHPTFCLHKRSGKPKYLYGVTKPLYIRKILVVRYHETEEHNQRELGLNTPWRGDDKVFWSMEYLPDDKKTTHPLHCIRYGDVSPGYKELVPAQPLETDRVFSVRLEGFNQTDDSDSMEFVLRPDSSGAPVRLEYANPGRPRGDFSVIER